MTINWGILGTGNIAATFASEFEYVKSGKILAVASRNKERAVDFAGKYDIERAYQSYESLVKDKDIDVVYVATPHNYHYENTILSLNNNKAVLCEKPVAVNSKQVIEMVKQAKENKLFFMEAMWTHFLPAVLKAKEWIREGKIGEIRYTTANFGFRTEIDPENRLFNPELAGGALLDVGIYPVSFVNSLYDSEPENIQATAYLGETMIDEYDSIILKYRDGSFAEINCSLQADLVNDAYIHGTEGTIHLPSFWNADQAVLENALEKEVFYDKRDSQGYNFEIEAVNRNLLNNEYESKIMPLNKSINNIKILDEVRRIIKLRYPFEE